MSDPTDAPEYYRKREALERAMAEQSQSETAKQIHLELAERYALLARETRNPEGKAPDSRGPVGG